MFLHPEAKRAGIEVKEQGCSVFPLDSPAGFPEDLENMVMFNLGEGFDLLPCRFSGFLDGVETVHNLE